MSTTSLVATGVTVVTLLGSGYGGLAAQARGAALAGELGCGACHSGVPNARAIRERAPALGRAGTPLEADFIFSYLASPVRRREDIGASRMPDFGLDEGERVALALYLGSGRIQGPIASARARHEGADAQLGARIWDALGCQGCHGSPERPETPAGPTTSGGTTRSFVDAVPGTPGPDLSREGARVRREWLQAYLAEPGPVRSPAHPSSPGSRMPDFDLTEGEVDALTTWIGTLGAAGREGRSPPPLTPHEAERTRRMLSSRVACLGCHVIGPAGGAIGPGGGAIGPSLLEVSGRLRPAFVTEMILDPRTAAPGAPMPRQPMPEREALRLARLILDGSAESGTRAWTPRPYRSLADPGHPAWAVRAGDDSEAVGADAPAAGAPADAVPAPVRPADASMSGAALYARHCAACHGPSGRGDGWNATDLPVPPTAHADGALMARRPDDTLYDGIHAGAWVLDGSPRMPPFGQMLSAQEIRSLVAYIRRLCDCEQPAWAGDGR